MESNSTMVVGIVVILIMITSIGLGIYLAFLSFRKKAREQKNYERSLKMVQIMIHLPPPSDDKDSKQRDDREVTDETVSRAEQMYNIISSTATRGFASQLYGQRHMSFEIVAYDGIVHYYAAVPYVILENVKQAILAAYPTARLEEVKEVNLFSEAGRTSGVYGGEFHLSKPYCFPLATYKDTKRDAMLAILNAMTGARRGEGVGVQILLRPAKDGWRGAINSQVQDIRDHKKGATSGKKSVDFSYVGKILQDAWKPENETKPKPEDKPLNGADQALVEAMEEKTKHAGYEVLIRAIASTPSSARSHVLIAGLQSAFSIFKLPIGNGLKFEPANDINQFITDYIMRFFPAEKDKDVLNAVEIASIFHLPNSDTSPSSKVERQTFKEVDGPTQHMDEGLYLGDNVFRGVHKHIRLPMDDRRRHVYIMGSTGMGKSYFMKSLVLQDMREGRGLAFIDPHGDTAEDILAMVPPDRVDDVIYFNPSDMSNPIGMNLFEIQPDDPDKEHTMDYIIGETNNMLYSLYDPQHQGIVGPRMTNIVRNAALLLMSSPQGGTFMDIPKVLVDPEFTKPRIKYLKNQRAIDFWTKEWPNAQRSNDAGEVTDWVVSKWADFENTMMTNILGQLHSTLNIREAMDNHKILLVNLSKGRLGEMSAKLLGMVFVMKFQAAAMSRTNVPEDQRPDFCLYVDEFQNFATDSFESILSEARKYHLNLIVANQFMNQLTDKIRGAILGNVGTYIIGRVGTEDVEEIAKLFQPVFQPEDLLFMPNRMAAVKMLIHGAPTSPFTMNLPSMSVTPNPELAKTLEKLSARKYGTPRAQVEAEIRQRMSTESSAPVPKKKKAESVVTTKPAEERQSSSSNSNSSNSFLDNWLAKRNKLQASGTIPAKTERNTLTDKNTDIYTDMPTIRPSNSLVPQEDRSSVNDELPTPEMPLDAPTSRRDNRNNRNDYNDRNDPAQYQMPQLRLQSTNQRDQFQNSNNARMNSTGRMQLLNYNRAQPGQYSQSPQRSNNQYDLYNRYQQPASMNNYGNQNYQSARPAQPVRMANNQFYSQAQPNALANNNVRRSDGNGPYGYNQPPQPINNGYNRRNDDDSGYVVKFH